MWHLLKFDQYPLMHQEQSMYIQLSTMQHKNLQIKLVTSLLFPSGKSQETRWGIDFDIAIATTIGKVHVAIFQPLFRGVHHMKVIAMSHENKGGAMCDIYKSHVF